MSYDWRREYEKQFGKLPAGEPEAGSQEVDTEDAGALPQQSAELSRQPPDQLRQQEKNGRHTQEPDRQPEQPAVPNAPPGASPASPGNQHQTRGGAAAARVAHNHEVAGSIPAPATIIPPPEITPLPDGRSRYRWYLRGLYRFRIGHRSQSVIVPADDAGGRAFAERVLRRRLAESRLPLGAVGKAPAP